MVETRGYTLEEVAIAFDPTSSSLADARLIGEERDAVVDGAKQRDLEDQK